MNQHPKHRQSCRRDEPLRHSWIWLFRLLGAALAVELSAPAQPAVPHIGYVYPAGGEQGTTFQATIGGQFLDGVTNVFVSGNGVQATVIDFNKPMPQGLFNKLRDQLKELQDRKASVRRWPNSTNVWTAADEKTVAEIRGKILKNPPNRQGNPAIAATATLRVTMATNAAPGEREIRLGTPAGLSNPLVFCVDQLPEFSQPLAKAPSPEANRFRERFRKPPVATPVKSEPRITLPAVVNGQIMPGRADRFRFHARKGQQLVAIVRARELIPYLADAVPGWFQATLALYDAKGKELAYDDDFRFHPDPVLHYEIPKDGDYVIEIKDAIYRGREDFVYRIAVGELPFITSIFPLGGKVDDPTMVTLAGWNLPGTKSTQENQAPGIHSVSVSNDERVSNPMPFVVDTLPEGLDQEPNNESEQAQKLTLPIIINGRIDQPGDTDVFRFAGRAGDEIVAEVHARRLASPLDSVLKLTDATGKQLAFNDDHEDKASGLNTHHADSYLRTTLPATGNYYVVLGDTQHKGGEEYAYRLRVSPPRPDFELRVVPPSLTARAGSSVPLTVYALRQDGFTNEITLNLNNAPAGLTLSGGRVPANQDQVRMTLSGPPNPPGEPYTLNLEGRAIIKGQAIVHPAVPAEDMMQAFAYRHLVPAKEFKLAVIGRGGARSGTRIVGTTPVKIPAGGTVRIQVGFSAPRLADSLQFELSEPPDGITIQSVAPNRDGAEIILASAAPGTKSGSTGNLIVNAFAGRPGADQKGRRPANNQRAAIGVLPAIPFVIIPQSEVSGP